MEEKFRCEIGEVDAIHATSSHNTYVYQCNIIAFFSGFVPPTIKSDMKTKCGQLPSVEESMIICKSSNYTPDHFSVYTEMID